MIAVGFGCKRLCPLADLLCAWSLSLRDSGRALDEVSALFVPEEKRAEPALSELARELDKPLLFLPRAQLEAQAGAAFTHSQHALRHYGVPSVAETAALAGALMLTVDTPRLLAPRRAFGGATCALAFVDSS